MRDFEPGLQSDGRPFWYVLDGHTPVPATSMNEVEALLGDVARRRVAYTQVDGDCYVSTVFLCLDHSWIVPGPIEVFETMIFRNGDGEDQWHYATWEAAEAGHAHAVTVALGGVT